ncbi:hypothetical protein VTL71DRAFT_12681, partial [Oculimacula yallundae]
MGKAVILISNLPRQPADGIFGGEEDLEQFVASAVFKIVLAVPFFNIAVVIRNSYSISATDIDIDVAAKSQQTLVTYFVGIA